MNCVKPIYLAFWGFEVPCGRCVMCRKARSREWSVRLMHELQFHSAAAFLTLTYDDFNLPAGGLDKYEFQKFFKRLRKHFSEKKLKYYACGEYGDKTKRPHYHIVLYGVGFDDLDLYHPANSKPGTLASKLIEKIWTYGNNFIGQVNIKTCRYVANYVLKKYVGNRVSEYHGRTPPFQLQSKGLGKKYAEENSDLIRDRLNVYLYGKPSGLPRYYRKVLGITADDFKDIQIEKKSELLDALYKKTGGNEEAYRPAVLASRNQARLDLLARQALMPDRQ